RATRLHYDTRLERDGVLVSWAVPKGLPVRKGDKRLAVHTEDHPLEYGSFEGVIPEGHYGAGPVRIFDSGTFDELEWTDTKVSFRLHGERYRGAEFHLVKTRTDWLVFLSRPEELDVGRPPPAYVPMLAEGGYEPFDHPGWRFEPKLDGVRTLLYVDMESTRLVSRRGRDETAQYPGLAAAGGEGGVEGVVGKRLGSRYQPGRRTSDWRKIKLLNRQDCVILGWTPGTGSRSKTFGALLVGAYDGRELRWIGQVGTGFTD